MSFRSSSTLSRRMFAVLSLAALVTASTGLRAYGQTPATPAPPAQTPPAGRAGQTPPPAGQAPAAPGTPQPVLPMTSDAGLILFTVRAEYEAPDPADATKKIKVNGAADFEAFMAKVKEALEKSTKPEHKQMAAGWKLYKGLEGAEPGKVLYVAVVDPTLKGTDYDPLKIVREIFPTEAATLVPKMVAAVEGVNKLNLQNLMKMGGGN
jgi:hypothetical protein